MTKVFIRDKNNKIIGEQNLIEQGQYIKEIMILNSKLCNVNNKINLVLLSLNNRLPKKERIYFLTKLEKLKLEAIEISKMIKELTNSKKYNHFTQYDFKVESKDFLEFKPIISEIQKEKSKHLKLAYTYCKNRKRDNIMITLDSNE